MAVLVDVFPEKNITRITIEGEVTVDLFRSLWEHGRPTDDMIYIFIGADSSNITTEDVKTIALEMTEAQSDRKNLRTCFVMIDDELTFGLARMFNVWSEIEGGSVEIYVCRDLQDAEAWLGVDVPPHSGERI